MKAHIITFGDTVADNTTTELYIPSTWESVRDMRDALLEQSDPFTVIDRPLTDEKKTELLTYRKALRELPSAYDNADDAWENMPSAPEWME